MDHVHKHTILTLANMLADCSEEREMLEQEKGDALSDLRALQMSYQEVQDELATSQNALHFQREVSSHLRAEACVRPSSLETQEAEIHKRQHNLLLSLFHHPEVFQRLMTYMQGEGQQLWDVVGEQGYHTHKIRLIRDVRNLTYIGGAGVNGWGLKDAKEFIESYHWAPPAIGVIPDLTAPGECGCISNDDPAPGCPYHGEDCTHHTLPLSRVPETNDGG
jgi:hypothetical protein